MLKSKACTEWCWSTHMCWEQNWYPLQSSRLKVKAEYTETCPLAYWCPAILSFQTDMDATLHAHLYVSGRVWAVTVLPVVFQCRLQMFEFLQWHSSVGRIQLSFSSGVPVYPASIRWVAQWYPSVHWVDQLHSNGIPVYTGQANLHWLRVREVNLFTIWKLRCAALFSRFCIYLKAQSFLSKY